MAPRFLTARDKLELRLKRIEKALLDANRLLEEAFEYIEQLKKDDDQ